MKKTISEFFENAEEIDRLKVASITLDSVYIVSTSKKHPSGFKYLTIYGYDKNKDKYYLLSTCADLVDIHNNTDAIISIDYPRVNIQRLFINTGIKFKCSYFITSTFRIEVLKDEQ